jgi:hypothetical protein
MASYMIETRFRSFDNGEEYPGSTRIRKKITLP